MRADQQIPARAYAVCLTSQCLHPMSCPFLLCTGSEVRPTTARRLAIVGWFHRHAEAAREATDDELSPLALAIREHFLKEGKVIKVGRR